MKKSLKQPLKQQVQNQLNEVQLDKTQLAALEKLMAGGEDKGKKGSSRTWIPLAAAGMFLFAVITAFMTLQFSQDNLLTMPQQIAEEVVSNHLKLKPLEVKTGSIDAVRGYFTKLDFMPVESSLQALDNLQLIGGRYCSLQGITAAQLRMKQGENLQTLYETEYVPDVFGDIPRLEKGEAPLVVYAKGIKVKVWVEKGLLFALTDSPEVAGGKEMDG
ncbi:MAG: hypothetical protein QNL05_01060 [Gammaproteobacteria bacterium]|nr:hypothetical protein [Gammaproteobacteria bacterium]MDX2486115.1 hypothetical protein [Gammaproteobacteria bacterium]